MSGTPDSFLKNYQEVEAFAEGDEEEYEEEVSLPTFALYPYSSNPPDLLRYSRPWAA